MTLVHASDQIGPCLRSNWFMPPIKLGHASTMPPPCLLPNSDITAPSELARHCALAFAAPAVASAAPVQYPPMVSTVVLGQVVAEFLGLKSSGRLKPTDAVAGRNGRAEFCGSEEVASLTVVAPGGSALVVLGVGTRERTVEIWEEISPPGLFWDLKPHRVLLGGVERTFRPLGGSLVIGYVESGDLSVILCQLGGRVAIVTCEGGLPTLIFVSAHVDALGILDLDTYRLMTARSRTPRPQTAVPCDVELSQLIAGALRDLAARCMLLECPQLELPQLEPTTRSVKVKVKVKKVASAGTTPPASSAALPRAEWRRGKRDVGAFVELLIALGGLGCGDLAGTSTDMCKQIQPYFPGREVVSPRKLSEVLRLMARTGTCLIDRPTARGWLIRLGELRRAGSQLLKRFIAESPPSSALSVAASASLHGVTVRPRANGALDQLREKLAAAVPKP